MANLITKDDFGAYVQWSNNIPAANVDYHCADSQNFDVEPIMPTAVVSGNNMLTDIIAALAEDPQTKPELIAFYNAYVKPLLVLNAYRRFLLVHGINITQFGSRVNNEETSNEISDKRRAEIMADAESKANVYLAKMTAALKLADYTYDTIVYDYQDCSTSKPRAKTRIAAI